MVMMRFLVNREYQATNLLTVKHNAVGFAFWIVDGFFNGCAGDDLAVLVDMVVTLTELHHRAILERPLIVKDKLLTVICCEGNKSNIRFFYKNTSKIKIELRLCECNNPSSLGHLIRHYGTTVHSLR